MRKNPVVSLTLKNQELSGGCSQIHVITFEPAGSQKLKNYFWESVILIQSVFIAFLFFFIIFFFFLNFLIRAFARRGLLLIFSKKERERQCVSGAPKNLGWEVRTGTPTTKISLGVFPVRVLPFVFGCCWVCVCVFLVTSTLHTKWDSWWVFQYEGLHEGLPSPSRCNFLLQRQESALRFFSQVSKIFLVVFFLLKLYTGM